jgi:alpha-glucosidase
MHLIVLNLLSTWRRLPHDRQEAESYTKLHIMPRQNQVGGGIVMGVLRLNCCLLLLILVCAVPGAAQWVPVGNAAAVRPLPNGVEVRTASATVRVTALNDNVIRVRAARGTKIPPDESWAVLPEAAWTSTNVRVQDSRQAIEFATATVRVRIEKTPLRISFLDPAGRMISEDAPGRTTLWQGASFTVWKSMPDGEEYFGLGDKAGPMNRRNMAFTNWNTDAFAWQDSTDPLYKSIPFFLGLKQGRAYGIFLDNTWRSFFDFGKQSRDALSFGSDGGPLDYYFIAGPEPKKVVERYAWLTGRTPLMPRYTLGYQQCRYSYYPEARVREVAATFRQKRIPADIIYLDIDYQDRNRPFTIDRQKFPTFEQMIKDLHAGNWRVIAITDLHIARAAGYTPYESGLAGDHFVKNPDGSLYVAPVWPGPSVFPEFTLARTRDWWGRLYTEFAGMGIDGFWNDMNEPSIFETATKTMPLGTVHRLEDGRSTTHREIHNVFGMLNSRSTYEGLLKLRPNTRPTILTRASFAGGQRYAATWTGDNTSSWDHYRISVANLLNHSVSAFGFVGDDIGGFYGSPTPDLLTRWHQLGAFNPIFRNHTIKGSPDQEPWVHGPEHEAIRKRYIELRYELMPYTYTIAEEMSRTGVPMMRPMYMEYPQAGGDDAGFFWGSDILVAPLVWPQIDSYDVRIPPGEDWYDYWTGRKVKAGENLNLSPKLDQLPLFVRPGAIIPHQPVVQSTAEVPEGPLELRVYPGRKCRGEMYWDDGETLDHRKGESTRVAFSCTAGANAVSVSWQSRGNYAPWWKEVKITVYGVERQPKTGAWDANTRSASIVVPAKATQARVEW